MIPRESVDAKQVMQLIKEQCPDMPDVRIAEILDIDPRNLRNYRQQNRMSVAVADRLLVAVGLSHLLADDTIEVKVRPVGRRALSEEPTKMEMLELKCKRQEREI